MTKDVLVYVEGMQLGSSDENKVSIVTPGTYYKKKDHHFVMYEELDEDSEQVTKNILRFDGDFFEISKRGLTNVDMVFEKNKRNMSNYVTPFGSMLVGIDADQVDISEEDDSIKIKIDYALDINYEHFADCKIRMDIRSKKEEQYES